MSHKRCWSPSALVHIGFILVVTLAVSAPMKAQGPESSPPSAPPPPVQASDCTSSAHVLVSWTAVPGATSYVAKRSQTETGPTINACVLPGGTSCADTAVDANRPHYYWVEPHFPFSPPGELRGPDMGTRLGSTPAPPTGVQATDGAYTDRYGCSGSIPPALPNTTCVGASRQLVPMCGWELV